jgi:hypothetical protein
VPADGTCFPAALNAGDALATPTGITFANVNVDQSDGTQVERTGTGDLFLTWEVGTPAPQFYVVTVSTVTGMNMQTQITRKRTYIVFEPKVAIARQDMTPANYIFKIQGFSGYPGAATGDLRPLAYPQAVTTAFSAVFTIAL